MKLSRVVLMTDHSSTEGSRSTLVTAVAALTGDPPVLIDARHFMTGGNGRVNIVDGALRLQESPVAAMVTPSVVLVYEIPPLKRRGFEGCQRLLRKHGAISLGTDAEAWRAATHKDLMVEQFALAGIPQMQTISLSRPTLDQVISGASLGPA